MVTFDDAPPPEGDEEAVPPPPPKSKSFAAKSLGESEKTGVQVTLFQLRYKVKAGKEWRYLLGNPEPLTGTLDPGMMIALMGSSGAGKSTLMDVISKRKTVGAIEGLVLFDGHIPSKSEVSRDTGYVEQRDSLWSFFSVHEILAYTARLKMPPKYSLSQKMGRVDEVIEQMGLGKSRNTRIGGAMVRGVSGGEAKRISIAIGLLNNPRIMFFDEPTSGLDSAISVDVMTTVRNLADEGRTVLVTIHQPSGKVFGLFDQIILLSRDMETKSGNIVYFGEAGEEVKKYFEAKGFPYDAGEVDNIAEYLLNIVSGGVSGPKGGNELIEGYANSDICDENERIAEGVANLAGMDHAKETSMAGAPAYANSIVSEIQTLLLYKGTAQWKDPFFLASRVGLWAVAALLIDTLYAGQKNTPQSLLVVVAVIFITIFITAIITIIYIPALINDKPVFIRESHDANYRPLSYATANFLIETSATAVSSIAYVSILYWAIMGVMRQEVGPFFFFMLTHFIYSSTACVVTLSIASPLPNIEISAGAVAVYALLNVAVMGFLAPVPPWWGWAALISYMRWTFGALMINQFKNNPNIDICSDVPEDEFLNFTALSDPADPADPLAGVAPGGVNIDGIVCSGLELLDTLGRFSNSTSQEIVAEVCPGPEANVVSNTLFTPLVQNGITQGCNPLIGQLLYGDLPDLSGFSDPDIGAFMLNYYPQGDGYDARPKFSGWTKWECLGILIAIFFVFYILYWRTCKLSISLVKR